MSEETEAARRERQMSWTGAGLGAGLSLVAAWGAPQHGLAAAGVALGAALSLLNFAWLKAGARALTRTSAAGGRVGGGAGRFLARFWLLAACLYAIFISHLVPMAWVIAGLFAVPAAVLVESTRMLAADLRR